MLAQTDTVSVKGTNLPKQTVDQYIEKYSAIAVDEMYRSKIPASITLAQGILESGNGNSRLAVDGNNHFGIKCKKTWTGKTIFEDDDALQECFRKYDAAIDSYRDHSDFLMNNPRYAFLFDLDKTDYKGWAYGLKKAGYATNPQYAELLITFIDRHKLHKFDGVKLSEEEDKELKNDKEEQVKSRGKEIHNNGVIGIIANANESYALIAMNYDLKVYQLYRFNDLEKDGVCKEGDTVYLKPKRNKSDSLYHLVLGLETMHWVSQRYAVKLDKLLERNLLSDGQQPAVGELIFLRNKRDNAPKLVSIDTLSVKSKVDTIIIDIAEPKPLDTTYDNKVYDNIQQNIETSKTVETVTSLDSIQDFKENLSFFHTAQRGETLYSIGKKYGIRVDAVMYLNLLTSDAIEAGQRLIINPAISNADTKEPQSTPGVHIVRQGETLFKIAKMYGLSIQDIKATNNLENEVVFIGQQLVIVKQSKK